MNEIRKTYPSLTSTSEGITISAGRDLNLVVPDDETRYLSLSKELVKMSENISRDALDLLYFTKDKVDRLIGPTDVLYKDEDSIKGSVKEGDLNKVMRHLNIISVTLNKIHLNLDRL